MANSITYQCANTNMVLQTNTLALNTFQPEPYSAPVFERFTAREAFNPMVSKVPANHNIISTGRLRQYFTLIQQVQVMEAQQRLNTY